MPLRCNASAVAFMRRTMFRVFHLVEAGGIRSVLFWKIHDMCRTRTKRSANPSLFTTSKRLPNVAPEHPEAVVLLDAKALPGLRLNTNKVVFLDRCARCGSLQPSIVGNRGDFKCRFCEAPARFGAGLDGTVGGGGVIRIWLLLFSAGVGEVRSVLEVESRLALRQ